MNIVSRRLCLVLGLAALVAGCGTRGPESITAAKVNAAPADKPLQLDVTRKGRIYAISDDADVGRIAVQTAGGTRSLKELLGSSGTPRPLGLVIGPTKNMGDHLPIGPGTGTAGYDCGVVCKCEGAADCMDMIVAGKCGSETWCSSTTNACFCTAKP